MLLKATSHWDTEAESERRRLFGPAGGVRGGLVRHHRIAHGVLIMSNYLSVLRYSDILDLAGWGDTALRTPTLAGLDNS